jgi:Protein of unknown function, DUF481
MLRIYQLLIKHSLPVCFVLLAGTDAVAQNTKKDTFTFQYKLGVNGILDKSLVTRLILSTQNNFIIRNSWTSFEPILNYRFGHVQPNGRPKTDLENDFFVVLKNHFLHQKKFFPSVLAGFENSPNIRRLNTRYYTGAGVGTKILKTKNNLLQIMLYGLFENSEFELTEYKTFRLMPFVKGNHYAEKSKVGVTYIINPYLSPWEKGNWRFRGNIRPYIKIAPKLDFSISYDLWYESLVSGNQPKEISVLMFGFNYSNF